MRVDLQALKTVLSFRALVNETHDVDRGGKVICPFHSDHTPSCHIYPDGFKCFACGAYGDAVNWLKQIYNLSTAEAIEELERRTGGRYISLAAERLVKAERPVPTFKPIDNKLLEAHRRHAERLDHVPAALQGRGFTLNELKRLQIAAYGSDAVLPITGPDGAVLALKRRYAEARDGQRYRYMTSGHGTPAWSSPGFSRHDTVLIVEGELNGMSCFLARPELAVMGTAGTGGALHLDVLRGRTVYVYADGDEPGQKARDKWAEQALTAGTAKVYAVDPWPMDACDIAGTQGRAALWELLS